MPKPGRDQPASGMNYIYDPVSAGNLAKNSTIPLHVVPAPVLMTSENRYLAGPGIELKDPDK